ncbi:MAG: PAS domain S-box protein [Dehalococcoidia bacterium]|nr:PAS domain S-box protein [Dehalococcoidia bacterium]
MPADYRSEVEAQALNERPAAIIEAADDAIIGKDLNAIVTSWNPGAERLYGYTALEMIGQSMKRLEPSEKVGEIVSIMTRIRKGDRIAHFETVRVRKYGTRVSISKSVSPIRNSKGVIIGAMNITHDMTVQNKRNETRLELEKFSSSRRLAENVSAELNDRLETIKNVHTMLMKVFQRIPATGNCWRLQ